MRSSIAGAASEVVRIVTCKMTLPAVAVTCTMPVDRPKYAIIAVSRSSNTRGVKSATSVALTMIWYETITGNEASDGGLGGGKGKGDGGGDGVV